MSSLAPLYTLSDKKGQCTGRGIEQMFTDAFDSSSQLIQSNPRRGLYLACGLIVRGNVQISDINRNIERLKPTLDLIYWNTDGFKVGLCSTPPVFQPYSLLCLANNCEIKHAFQKLNQRFTKLFRRRAHLHHYTEYMELAEMNESVQLVSSLMADYSKLERSA